MLSKYLINLNKNLILYMYILNIKKLYVKTINKNVLYNINIKIKYGEIHALIGPNGSGKSSLSMILAGNKKYKITKGIIYFKKKNINKLSIDKRAKEGLFISFQKNIEIPGLNNQYFLLQSYNAKRSYYNKKKINLIEFKKKIFKYLKKINLSKKFLQRSFNENFSGGEKKKNDILQMMILKPKLIILDEIDSGLDINTIKKTIKIINNFKKKKKSFLIITHNFKIFNYLKINKVHILKKGKIIKSGNKKIIKIIKKKGYEYFEK